MPSGLEAFLVLLTELSIRLALIVRVLLHRGHTSTTRLAWCAVLAGFPLGACETAGQHERTGCEHLACHACRPSP